MEEYAGLLLQILIFLPLVIFLAYISVKYGLGKANGYSINSNMKIIDRIALGPKSGLCIVKIIDKYYLLSQSEKEISILKELENYPEIPATSFKGYFNRFTK